ncbi:uncharacterized protein PY17X_0520300 [Plasmodium yoelii]|uniref:Uncharacterized protein n=3 Tax=Plasmodium yoelii TaxID=5861 RepID=A0AAE9WMP5_PLAYO|nr:uncharacterized protein PY17X_0520300 [Plasmodium yoelii]EAA19831.1 RING-finger protein [Plasmodium yoelii yoelii]WBY55731.1 hypothetical protein Py17XNL_000504557 [Plasmodium yoelii yoelii]CDU16792.1 CCAT-binding transcription factor-like protein, putative [Plasmodium yoelii]VTZ74410.1 conserved Plasmodium protein, unknown function [Plasmodium yoelii]|eukprot:XP_728266.1 uncharacterized protein PY17X_0520300 [Plasmodium yoelii]
MKNNIIKISFVLLFLSSYVSEINGNVTNKNKYSLRSHITKNEDLNNTLDNGNVHGESEDDISTRGTEQTLKTGATGTLDSSSQHQAGDVGSSGKGLSQDSRTEESCPEGCEGCPEDCEGCPECCEGCPECCEDCHDENCPDCQTECTDECREECAKLKAASAQLGEENIQICTHSPPNGTNCEECKKITTTRQTAAPDVRDETETTLIQNAIEDITDDTKTMPDENEPVCDEQLDEDGDNEEEEEIVDSENIEIIENIEEIENSDDSDDIDDSEELELEFELELEEPTDIDRDSQEENESESGATTTNEQGNNHNTNTDEVASNNQTSNNQTNNNQTSNNQTNNNNVSHFIIKEYKGNSGSKTQNENILDNALSGIDDNQFSSDIQDFVQDINEFVLMEEDI